MVKVNIAIRRLAPILATLVLLDTYGGASAQPEGDHPVAGVAKTRSWTVRDSISIAQLGAPEAGTSPPPFVYSPDGDLVAFVIRKGVLGTVRSRATLYVYKVADLQHFAAQADVPKPAPLLAASAETTDNRSAIRFVQWAAHGELLYTARNLAGSDIYSWHAGVKPVRELRSKSEVQGIMPLPGNRRLLIEIGLDQPVVNPDIARLANGRTLEAIQGIEKFSDHITRPSKLGVLDRKSHTLKSYDPVVMPIYGLWPSPDGRYVAALTPFPTRIDKGCWRPGPKIQPDVFVEPYWFGQAAYLLLDLKTGKSILPLGGPYGAAALGFQGLSGLGDDHTQAGFAWSADSKTAVAKFGLDKESQCGGSGSPLIPASYAIDVASLKVSKLATLPIAPDEPNHWYRIEADVNADGSSARVAAYYGLSGLVQAMGATFRKVGDMWTREGDWTAPIPKARLQPTTLALNQSLTTPPKIDVTDAQGHSRQLLSLVPSDAPIDEAKVTPFTWKDHQGVEWKGVLAVPSRKAAGPLPLIVQTHDYDESQFYSNGAKAMTCFPGRAAVARGFAVLTVIEAPSLEHTVIDSPQESAFVAGGYESAVRTLADQGVIDPARVAGIGWSRSGWWIDETINHYPNLFKSAVVCDNVDYSYLNYLLWSDVNPQNKYLTDAKYGGSPWSKPERWSSEATSFALPRARVPVRFEGNSGLSSTAWQWEAFQALRLNQVPSELWIYPGGTHVLERPQDIETSQQGALDWIDYWVNGHFTADPADPDRAERWSDMRREMQRFDSSPSKVVEE